MIRPAKPSDIEHLITVGAQVLSKHMDFLSPSEDRMRHLITECVSSAQNIALVSHSDDGTITGGALVITQPFAYAEKLHSQIIAIYAQEHGDGSQMTDFILEWFNKRKASLLLCYASPVASQLDTLLENKGFTREGTMLVKRRY